MRLAAEPLPAPAAGPGDDQQLALAAITAWYAAGGRHRDGGFRPLILGGLAGTGKSWLVGQLPQVLPRARIAYAAYTGKAVSVLRDKLGGRADPDSVTTLHRLLYSPAVMTVCTASEETASARTGRCPPHRAARQPCPAREQVSFTPREDPLEDTDLVVADEASMIPGPLWAGLTSHGVPVLAVGDHGQLPPVRSAFHLMEHPDLVLTRIRRQGPGSAVLDVAAWARERGHIPHGTYGPGVIKIRPHEIGRAGLHPGDSDMIICATNATRQWHNAAMRAWHGRSGPPQPGDRVICLRNNRDEGLFNGMRGIITDVTGQAAVREAPAFRARIGLDGRDAPWTGMVSAAQFGQPGTLPGLPRGLALFDWGYALTCHRSQGSEADRVLVIEEAWPPPGPDRNRWLYTACTRSRRELTVAGP